MADKKIHAYLSLGHLPVSKDHEVYLLVSTLRISAAVNKDVAMKCFKVFGKDIDIIA